jgi:hypothetical protein
MAGNDTACTLLLHFNGTDGSTSIPDDSLVGTHGSASVFGTAQLDTAVKTFGTASLLLDGDSDYITFPDSPDWDFSTTWTIDTRVRFPALPSAGNGTFSMRHWDTAGDQRSWAMWIENIGGTYKLRLAYSTDGAVTTAIIDSNGLTLSVDTWYHFAIIRNGNTITMTQDGVSIGTGDVTGVTFFNATAVLNIGFYGYYHNGYLDEYRISKIARWTSFPFTLPSDEYSEDTPAPTGSTRRIFLIT